MYREFNHLYSNSASNMFSIYFSFPKTSRKLWKMAWSSLAFSSIKNLQIPWNSSFYSYIIKFLGGTPSISVCKKKNTFLPMYKVSRGHDSHTHMHKHTNTLHSVGTKIFSQVLAYIVSECLMKWFIIHILVTFNKLIVLDWRKIWKCSC